MPLPNITLVGNLTNDPELRFTPSGKAVASFTVACSSSKRNEDSGEWDTTAECFVRCSVWEQTAENVAEAFLRGTAVVVTGQLLQRSYEDREGNKRYSLECKVWTVAAQVKDSVSVKINKSERGTSGTFAGSPTDDPWANGPGGQFADEPPPF